MIIPIVALLLLILPGLIGGRLSRLAGIQLQGTTPLLLALIAQFVVLQAFSDPGPVLRPVLETIHVGSYVVAAWFLWVNRRVPFLWLIGFGAATNGFTIAINGGTLPARPGALRTAGLPVDVGAYANSGALSHPKLWFLGDVFALPSSLPLANVFSIGDLLILSGVGLVALRICGSRFSAPWVVPTRFQRPAPAVRSYSASLSAFAFPASPAGTGPSRGRAPDPGGNWQPVPFDPDLPGATPVSSGQISTVIS